MRNNYDKLLKLQMLHARERMTEEAKKYYTDKWMYDDNENEQNSKWGYSLNRINEYIEKGYVEVNYKRYYFNEDKTEFRAQWWGY